MNHDILYEIIEIFMWKLRLILKLIIKISLN